MKEKETILFKPVKKSACPDCIPELKSEFLEVGPGHQYFLNSQVIPKGGPVDHPSAPWALDSEVVLPLSTVH